VLNAADKYMAVLFPSALDNLERNVYVFNLTSLCLFNLLYFENIHKSQGQ
jgi:hypothetical protein